MQQEILFARIDDEMRLLTYLTYNPRGIRKIAGRLKPEHFYRDIYQEMYRIHLECYQRDVRCSVDTMRYELTKINRLDEAVGHGQFLTMIEQAHPSSREIAQGNIESLATIIIQEAGYRNLSIVSSQIMQLAASRCDDAVSQALALVSDLALGEDSIPASTLSKELRIYIQDLRQRRIDLVEGNARGLATGYPELDALIGGLQPSSLNILAALTGLGKTAFAVNIAFNIALRAKRVFFFSLEMDNGEIVQRIISMDTEIDQYFLNRGEIDDAQMEMIEHREERLAHCDFLLDDRTYNIEDIITKASNEHAITPLDLIVVDYVQLVENSADGRKHETRAEEVAKLSRGLKRLARKLRVPVLALAQVNRLVDKQDKPPKLSDLSESAGLATNANIVMFLHTSEEELQKRKENKVFRVKVTVAKGRNARMGDADLLFAPRITKFVSAPSDENEEGEDTSFVPTLPVVMNQQTFEEYWSENNDD